MVCGFLMCMLVVACESTPLPNIEPTPTALRGVFILNQGGFNQNDASLSFYDPEERSVAPVVLNNPDKPSESEPLGDLGQDMLLYGNKLYISVNGSSYIRVLNVENKQTIAKIRMEDAERRPLSPRYLAAYDGKIYVTCWTDNSLVRIDTTSLAIDGSLTVGSYPEGLAACAYNGKLYVANSGSMMGNTVSVVDIANFRVESEITVGLNPNLVKASRESFIFVNYLGNYSDIPGGFQRIDLTTNTVTTLGAYPKNDFVWNDQTIYYYDTTYGSSGAPEVSYGKFTVTGNSYQTPAPLITDETALNVPFAIGLDPVGQNIYLADAKDFSNPGSVYIIDPQGKRVHSFSVGVAPCKFAFY